MNLPKRIPDNQKGNIHVLRIVQYIITRTLHHLPICKNNFPAIILLLLRISVSSSALDCIGRGVGTHEDCFVDEQDAGVGFEVDS